MEAKPNRIVLVSQGIDGGIAQMASLLGRELAKIGWRCHIVYFGRPAPSMPAIDDPTGRLTGQTITTGRARSMREAIGMLRARREASAAIERFSPDIVILAGVMPLILLAGAIRNSAPRLLFWDHGPSVTFYRIKQVLLRRALRKIDHQISVSKSSRQFYIDAFGIPGESISVVGNVADSGAFRSDGVAGDFSRLRIIMPARLDMVQKDFETLLRAIAILAEKKIDVTLDLAGSGPHEDRIRRLIAGLGLDSRVRLLGHVAKLGESLGRYNVVCLSTRFESFGLALAEGMLAGRLAVASRVIGVDEVVTDGKTGLLFGYANAEELAGRLIWAMQNPVEAGKIAAAGMEEAGKRFNAGAFAEAFDGICRRVYSRPASPLAVRASLAHSLSFVPPSIAALQARVGGGAWRKARADASSGPR
jgi:glycosyltransferase involved in cell wall biosynthesis